jgi:cytochrome c biogenesis protein CcmG, thiol:disulfide interchange protein DsbE
MRGVLLWLPLAMFVGFVALVAFGLRLPGDRPVASALIGQALPRVALPPAVPGKPGLDPAAAGGPRLLNVFASWCVPCAAEAPQLLALARAGVAVDAVAVRDRPADVQAFLRRWGDPYRRIGADAASRYQLAIGSSGVPESFVVDGHGIIRYQHIGDIRPEDVPVILAQIRAAR